MMQTCDDQRSIQETEDCAEDDTCRACDSCVNNCGDSGADLPADRAEDEMRCHDRESDTEERYEDH